jgi:hypothetical protein
MFAMTEKLLHTIRLVLGDPSGDGHGRTSTHSFRSSLTPDEVRQAYHKGVGIVGFDLIREEVNTNGNRFRLKPEYQEAMKAHSYANHINASYLNIDWIDYEMYIDIYLWIAKLGNPNLEVQCFTEPRYDIDIGGYRYES